MRHYGLQLQPIFFAEIPILMNFENRIKKEMTEGIVRAILDDAGYHVIDFGIEKIVRETVTMPKTDYLNLAFPDVMRNAPDLVVLDKSKQNKILVEIKYRTKWDGEIFEEVKEQVKQYKELVLVSIFSSAPNPQEKEPLPSRYLRCCRLRYLDDKYEIEVKQTEYYGGGCTWIAVEHIKDNENLWWKMSFMQEIFKQINEQTNRKTLINAIQALAGILNS